MAGKQWRVWKENGLWMLRHPCGYAQHPESKWIVWKAWQLWDDIYKEGSRGVPS